MRVAMSMICACTFLGSCASQQPASRTTQSPGAAAGDLSRSSRGSPPAGCRDLPNAADLKEYLRRAPAEGGDAGGMFGGKLEWAAIVNRNGEICAAAVATDDPAGAWPASQAIAKAKAYTANAFSTDDVPMSTARLYTLTQPGHSLWGVAALNPFDPACLAPPHDSARTDGKVCGGTISLGGGVPLYKARRRLGGLGVSGDTACADHEIAKRIRHIAQLDPERGQLADDINYAKDGSSVFTHPVCPNTWLNGRKVGDEMRASATSDRR
jgi:uncharacterized protein GlcG (DUF336 family)